MVKNIGVIQYYLISTIVLIFSLFFGFLIYRSEENYTRSVIQADYDHMVLTMQERINHKIIILETVLRWIPSDIDQNKWEDIIEYYYQSYIGYQAINWIDTQYNITYIYPYDSNISALGRNVAEGDDRLEPFLVAEQTGSYVFTPILDLFQGGKGVVVHFPVYKNEKIFGYISSVFRLSDLLPSAIDTNNRYTVYLKDNELVVWESGNNFNLREDLAIQSKVEMKNKMWNIELIPTRDYIKSIVSPFGVRISYIIVLVGIIIEIFLFSMSYNQNMYLKSLVAQKVISDKNKQQQQLVTMLTERAKDVVYVAEFSDNKWVLKYISNASLWLIGYSSDYIIENQNLTFLEDVDSWYSFLDDTARKRIPTVYEYQVKTIDGNLLWVEDSMVPIVDMKSSTVIIEGIIRDVTSRKNRERKIEHKNEELEQFIEITSHDFKTPLRSLQGLVGILYDDYKDVIDDDGLNVLDRIRDASEKSVSVIEAMNEYTALETSYNLEKTDVDTLIKEGMRRCQSANIDIHNLSSYDEVWCDRRLILRLFLELYDNSVKFNNKNVNIKIEVHNGLSLNNVIILFRDNGIGVNSEYHKKIFRIFNKLNPNESIGLGMGLAIAKKIVQLHGGDISADQSYTDGFGLVIRLSTKGSSHE